MSFQYSVNSFTQKALFFFVVLILISPFGARANGLLGVYHGNQGWAMNDVTALEAWQGKKHAVLTLFAGWPESHRSNMFNHQLPNIWNNGNVPLISWEPYVPTKETTSDTIESDIANGDHDTYIQAWADDLKVWLSGPDGTFGNADDRRVYIRLAHEMNGNWYPWSAESAGETPTDYINMWRHVHDQFTAKGMGKSHIQWIWSVNNTDNSNKGHKVEDYYPGDMYVDWFGIDGYNWGNKLTGTSWSTPAQVFTPMLERLKAIANKPVSINETAAVSEDGTKVAEKSQWITDLFAYAKGQEIGLISWFNETKSGYNWSFFDGAYGDDTAASGENVYTTYKQAVADLYWKSSDANNPRLITDDEFQGAALVNTAQRFKPTILIPLYNYPNHYDPANYIWDDVAAAQSKVDVVAIINPSNGPGTGGPNADYQQGLKDLKDAGVKIIGYVPTCWANSVNTVGCFNTRSQADMEQDITEYATHFDIDGIFFDEAATTANEVNFYKALTQFAKSKGLQFIVTNPGTEPATGYFDQSVTTVSVNFESPFSTWNTKSTSTDQISREAWWHSTLVYDVPDVESMKQVVNQSLQRNYGYIYITDDNGANPWDELPSYWQAMVDYLGALQSGTDVDNDSSTNLSDNCPAESNSAQTDTDKDDIGDACDLNDDNDAALDAVDAFPLDRNETIDTDGDLIGNNADTDDDGDQMPDSWETANNLNPLDPSDAGLDPDNDNKTNLQEYQSGSNPNVAEAVTTTNTSTNTNTSNTNTSTSTNTTTSSTNTSTSTNTNNSNTNPVTSTNTSSTNTNTSSTTTTTTTNSTQQSNNSSAATSQTSTGQSASGESANTTDQSSSDDVSSNENPQSTTDETDVAETNDNGSGVEGQDNQIANDEVNTTNASASDSTNQTNNSSEENNSGGASFGVWLLVLLVLTTLLHRKRRLSALLAVTVKWT